MNKAMNIDTIRSINNALLFTAKGEACTSICSASAMLAVTGWSSRKLWSRNASRWANHSFMVLISSS